MNYRVSGLAADPFRQYFGLNDNELAAHGIQRRVAEEAGAFPDRVEMRDAEIGESLLLLNYQHQPAASPYRASHAIYVLEGAGETWSGVNEVPQVMKKRIISLRGFDAKGCIQEAEIATGDEIEKEILRIFENSDVSYIHAHNAKQGCYAGLIERA